MGSRVLALSGSPMGTLAVRGEQSIYVELKRVAMRTIDMGRQSLEKMHKSAEALQKKNKPDEFSEHLRRQFQESRDTITEGLNKLEVECERTKPNPSYYEQTEQGQQQLREDQALWMEAAAAVLKTTRSWTDFFKDLVQKAVEMLNKIFTMIMEKVKDAYKLVEDFMVWFADAILNSAKIRA